MKEGELEVLEELKYLRQQVADLRKSGERFQRLMANARDILFHINLFPKPHFEYLSPSITSVTGYNYQDFMKDFESYMQIVHPDDRHLVSILFEGKFIPKIQLRWMHREGHELIVEVHRMPIYNEQGQLVAVEGITRNITEHYQLQEELRLHRDHLEELVEERTNELKTINQQLEREIVFRKRVERELKKRIEYEKTISTRFYALLEQLPISIHFLKPDYSISFTNRYFRQQFGDPGQRPCYEVFEGRQEPCEICHSIKSFKSKNHEQWEWVSNKGQTFYYCYFPFSDIDGTPMVLGLGIDITKRKEMEKEMARLDRLDLVGQMAAGIGHEVRNPMTTVRGFLQMLKEKKECDQYKEYFDLMIGELDRANLIITEYLSLTKKKANDIKPQNLNDILLTLQPLIEVNAMQANISVDIHLQEVPDLPLDDKEIRQLIMNLVRNAVEAMPGEGRITIKTFLEQGDVVLSVQDEGTGMNQEVMRKLGTPFFTTKDQGTGLGLAVCYSIANRHNARIEAESSSSGTTFFVRFKSL